MNICEQSQQSASLSLVDLPNTRTHGLNSKPTASGCLSDPRPQRAHKWRRESSFSVRCLIAEHLVILSFILLHVFLHSFLLLNRCCTIDLISASRSVATCVLALLPFARHPDAPLCAVYRRTAGFSVLTPGNWLSSRRSLGSHHGHMQ